jgi:hypothetical protein
MKKAMKRTVLVVLRVIKTMKKLRMNFRMKVNYKITMLLLEGG